MHLSVYDDFSVLIVEKYEILIKADVVGVMILRGIDERRIQLEIVVCGIENFMLQKAEKSMLQYLSKILKIVGKEKNLEVKIQEKA